MISVQGPSQMPRMIRGLVVVRCRSCGKPNCRCADGQQLHASRVLSYSEAWPAASIGLGP